MAHALRIFGARIPPDAVLRLLDAALRARIGARLRERDNSHRRAASLNADAMRDIAMRFRCDSIAPLGVPVVPDV